jgi:hypothetical protein
MKQGADFQHKFDKGNHEHCIRYRVMSGHKVQRVKVKGEFHPKTGYESPDEE